MRLLLDMNVSPSLARELDPEGHDAEHVLDLGMGSASDEAVMARAVANRRCLVTADLDFAQMLAASRAARPSVVILRLRDPRPDRLRARHLAALRAAEAAVEEGAIVVDEGSVRVRRLPV